jgi:hypothetical protein
MVKHLPWRNADGERASGETTVIKLSPEEVACEAEHREVIPRSMYIRVSDLHQHGFTSGCQGCISIIRGKPRQGHSKACRERLQDALKHSNRFQAAEERINHYLADKLEKEDMQRKRARLAQASEQKPFEDVVVQAAPAAFEGGSSGSGLTSAERKRGLDEAEANEAKRRQETEDREMDVERHKRALENRPDGEVQKKRLTVQEALARMNSDTNHVMRSDFGRSLNAFEGSKKGQNCQHQGGGELLTTPLVNTRGGGRR